MLLFTVAIVIAILASADCAALNSELRRHGGAVVTNGLGCAEIGTNIFKQNGSAADAAIATLFCEGVLCPQSMGLGGGFLLTIYTRSTKTVETLIARETAPIDATKDMFSVGNVSSIDKGLRIAVPGELKGYWELHQKYGKLKWENLIQPTIELCKNGHQVSQYFASILMRSEKKIRENPNLREIFINPATDKVWIMGDHVKRSKLAESLAIIAQEGSDALYSKNGTLLTKLLSDLKDFKSIIKEEDFLSYNVRWEKPISSTFDDDNKVYGIPTPGSGLILSLILNILNGYKDLSVDDPLTWHRVIESFKFASVEKTRLGDLSLDPGYDELVQKLTSVEFAEMIRHKIDDEKTYTEYKHYGGNFGNVEDQGTAHISVLAPNGDAVAATSTINHIFGSELISPSTGIILNNQMLDFSTPGKDNVPGLQSSPSNFIKPGKRPLSSMCPTIIVDKNDDVRMVIGGAGGSYIISAMANVILRNILFNEDLTVAVGSQRVHHQLAQMKVKHESGFDRLVLDGLAQRGHLLEGRPSGSFFGTLVAITRNQSNFISVAFDPRRNGSASII